MLLYGPFWLLQLWLNTTFESFLPRKNKINEKALEILNRRVKGTKLVLLTPTDEGKQFQKAFTSFVMMFAERKEFVSTMVPVVPQNFPSHFFNISHHKTLGIQDPVRVSSAQDFSLHC